MTKINLIEKRKKSIEQRMNKLKEMEASLNVQERKRRTRKLIELGGLVSKAQLEDWNSNTLLGALLFLKENESNQQQINAWTHKGGSTFASEKVQKTPVIVKFKAQPGAEVRTTLKSLGLKWNALRKEWEGYAHILKLKAFLEPHKASIQELEDSSGKY